MKTFFKNKIDDFINYLIDIRGYSELTSKTYALNLEEALNFIDIEKNEDDFYEWNLTPYRTYLREKNKKTISKKISIVRSFVKYLEEFGYKIYLIADESIKIPRTLPKPISFEKIKEALLKANEEERIIILLLYGLGLRISELSSLKKDIVSKEWVRIEGKGSKTREIPILPIIKRELVKYINIYNPKEYLFERDGEKLSENSLRYKITKSFKRIGIKVTPHQLRHSFASDILNKGGRITDVSKLLGHSSLSTTEIYTKLNNSYKLKSYIRSHPMAKDMDEPF